MTANKVVVVDYGMGNLRSVYQALRHAAPEADIRVSTDPVEVVRANRIVLPGQGAMPDCMKFLRESQMQEAVLKAARHKPLLGICVGEQMLCDMSEESISQEPTPGLGLIPGRCIKFRLADMQIANGLRLKVPHMGWNHVHQTLAHPLWEDIPDETMFYFVHSYYVVPAHLQHTAGQTIYGKPGTLPFTCAIARDNIFATQFHPEKSAGYGLQLYRNFVHWQP